jgi:enoyl-CoA hydratase/carnithine racemase
MTDRAEEWIQFAIADHVATVRIARPEAKNALTKSMYVAIRDACVAADQDPAVDVLVLRGSGSAFAVGGDLKELLDILESEPSRILDYEQYLPFAALKSLAKPTVAVVDGLCMGGGLTLASMCDIIVATDRSRFAIPEAKVGIVDGHLPRLLRDIVPPPRLRYWMYTGAMFPASEALAAGLLTCVVAPEELEAWLQDCLVKLKSSSQAAIRACKRILNEHRHLSAMTDAFDTLMQPETLARLQQFRAR